MLLTPAGAASVYGRLPPSVSCLACCSGENEAQSYTRCGHGCQETTVRSRIAVGDGCRIQEGALAPLRPASEEALP